MFIAFAPSTWQRKTNVLSMVRFLLCFRMYFELSELKSCEHTKEKQGTTKKNKEEHFLTWLLPVSEDHINTPLDYHLNFSTYM